MASKDRRHFIPFGSKYFLWMRDKAVTSDQVHGFMNELTGLSVSLDAPNGVAFDQWRQKMRDLGYEDAWKISEERELAVRAAAAKMLAEEAKRIAAMDAKLADLRIEAPDKPAGELLREYEKRLSGRN
jgi:hypothetical protein